MVEEKKRRLPPYVSYRTFRNFLDRLGQQQVPARIDRSFWGDLLSGSNGTQLMAALHFLNLIDANNRPTPLLRQLVTAKTEQRTQLFREITNQSFNFALKGLSDTQNATYAQLQEVFHDTFQLADDVSRKCIKFFTALSSDAGIPLSPFITKRMRLIQTGTKSSGKRVGNRTNRNINIPQSVEKVPSKDGWNEQLLAKFPTFDPSWSEEIKEKWFQAFDELLKRGAI
ncbi:MAG: DUF5343 domain-containing protein [Chloroflexota bacterium]